MWKIKILNWLLGRHYVWVKDCGNSYICRVEALPNGDLMGKILYRNFFITKAGKAYGGYWIEDWRPLTFKTKIQESDCE